MKKSVIAPSILFGLIGAGILIWWLAQPPKDALEHAFLNNRNWEEITFEPHKLPYFEDRLMFNALAMKIRESGIYITDFGDVKVKRFDFEGKLLAEIGDGIGQGPGELQLIAGFDVAGENLWIADSQTRHVSRFSIEGDFEDRFSVGYHPLRVHRVTEGLAVMGIGRATLFELFDEMGETKRAFGQFFEDQRPDDGLVLQGGMVSGQDGGFVYVPMYASKLYYYNALGDLHQEVNTVDGIANTFMQLRTRPTSGQTQFVAPEERHTIYPAGRDDQVIYMLTMLHFPEEDPSQPRRPSLLALDRYDAATGQYLSSSEPPLRASEMRVFGGKLYALAGDTTLVAYDMIFED